MKYGLTEGFLTDIVDENWIFNYRSFISAGNLVMKINHKELLPAQTNFWFYRNDTIVHTVYIYYFT
jgi:hypothetical protein